MPAFYTHYRFGCDVLKQLPEDIRSICTAHRGLFDIGLHGPDIYFFYRPVLPNKVNRIGYAAHKRSGRYFLQRAQKVIASAHDKDAARAYFYGLLCHFTLDSICHPYIHTAMKEFNVTHAATETAFDRALLLKDGKDPQHFDPCGHFEVNTRNAAVITPFYTPEATVALTEKSISSMVFYGRVLFTPNKALRRAQEKLQNGMSGFLTQPVLSAQAVVNLKKTRETLGEKAKILAGIMPVVSQRNAIFMENEVNGIHVDAEIIERFAGLDRAQGEELGLEVSVKAAQAAAPYADGFYLMTPFNRIALMERLIARLKGSRIENGRCVCSGH